MRAKLAGVGPFVAVLALATWAPAQEATPTTITDIRQESTDRSTRLVVECTGPLAYTYYSPDPLTLVIDIPEVDASQIPARINVGTREVESLRVTSLARADGRNLARVEVRLASLVPYQVFSKDKALNLVFERPASLVAAAGAQRRPPTRGRRWRRAPARGDAAAAAAGATVAEPRPDAPPATDRRRAASSAVSRDEIGGLLAFTVKADGRLSTATSCSRTRTGSSSTSPDVTARASVRSIDVGENPVRKVRLGQFSAESPKVARLVLDLSGRAPYRIIDGTDGVRIVFGESGPAAPAAHAPLAAMRAAEPEPRPREPVAPAPAVAATSDRAPRGRRAARPAAPARAAGARGPAGAGAGPRPGEHRHGLRRDGQPGHPDQPRLQGRGPAGHLPPVLRHLRPQRGGEPGRHRQGHAEAERGALGTGARAHPEDERARLRARGERHPHREAHRPPARGGGPAQAPGGEGARRGPGDPHPAHLLRQGRRPVDRAEEREGGVGPRRGERRRADEHHHHARPAELRREGQEPDRRARHRDAAGGDRGADRGHDAQLHPRPRHPVGLRRRGANRVRQHHEQDLPERDRPERRRACRASSASPPTTSGRAAAPPTAGIGHAGPRLRRQPAGQRLQHRHRHLDGQHPGQLQPRRGAHGPRAAGPRAPALDAEGDDPEQQAGRDQAGRADPDPDAGEQHGDRRSSRTRC